MIRLKKTNIFIAIAVVALVFAPLQSYGQECEFQSLQWVQSTVSIGQTAHFSLFGTNCGGLNIRVKVLRSQRLPDGTFYTKLKEIPVQFSAGISGMAAGQYTPTTGDYGGETTANIVMRANVPGETTLTTSGVLKITGGSSDENGNGDGNGGSGNGSGGGGESQIINFELKNPLDAENFVELIDVIATWLFNLAIPIAVAMIVYAGVLFLISRGDTTKITKAKQVLLYAVVGFAIILIGKGFITLIESVLNLGTGP